jgi:hypothetical protein
MHSYKVVWQHEDSATYYGVLVKAASHSHAVRFMHQRYPSAQFFDEASSIRLWDKAEIPF